MNCEIILGGYLIGMEVEIKKKLAFSVAGINKWVDEASQCPEIWDTLFDKYLPGMLEKIGDGTKYAVIHGRKDEAEVGNFYYLAGFDVGNVEEAKTLDMDVLEIEDTEYAVLELHGPAEESLKHAWHHLNVVFFPQSMYEPSEAPQIEVYHEGDITHQDYTMELWVPVRKKV